MSEENVEVVRRGYEYWFANGEVLVENFHPDFVSDMSTFRGWPERKTYPGVKGAMEFLADWGEAWEEWQVEVEDYIDAGGEMVVTILRQRGRSKATGVSVEMQLGQVWTIRDGAAQNADVRESGGHPRSRRAVLELT